MSQANVYKWSAIDRISNSVLTFTGNLILARLLSVSDFGLLAMVAIFSAIAYNFSSCGLSDGLIHKKEPTARDYSTVFVYNISVGVLFCLLFIALSGPLARFFGHPEIRYILWANGICMIFTTMWFTQETRMRKELNMRAIALVHIAASLSALILGVALALYGLSYWGLVAMRMFVNVFIFIYYVIASRWIPRIAFYRESFKALFGYGWHLMSAYIITQIGRNVNSMVLGKFATPALTGIFAQGQKLEEVPFSVTEAMFNSPFFAIVSNEKTVDGQRRLCSQMNVNLFAINLTLAFILVLAAWPAFNVLYGSKWDAAVPVFQVLIIYGVCTAMKYFYQTVLKVHARTRMVRNLTFVEVVIQLILLALFFKKGVIMIAMTQVIAAVVVVLVYIGLYKHLQKLTLSAMLKEFGVATGAPLSAAIITGLVSLLWIGRTPYPVSLALYILVYALALYSVCRVFNPPYYTLFVSTVKNKLHKR